MVSGCLLMLLQFGQLEGYLHDKWLMFLIVFGPDHHHRPAVFAPLCVF